MPVSKPNKRKTENPSINAMNNEFEGGGLASLAYPAKVICLTMSDIGSDEMNIREICGGPTIKIDPRDLLSTAYSILDKYGVHAHELPHAIREILIDQSESSTSDDNRPFDTFVDNYVIASSQDSLEEMYVAAFQRGYVPIKMSGRSGISSSEEAISLRRLSSDYTRLVSLMILAAENKITRTEMYREICEKILSFDFSEDDFLKIFPSSENWGRGLYILISPPSSLASIADRTDRKLEETFRANETGSNQELAIYFSLDWYLRVERYPILSQYVVWFLGGSTHGRDGNTKYAGAYSYGNLAVDVYEQWKELSKSPKNLVTEDGLTRQERLAIHESILPDRVLSSGNSNSFFLNVNHGEELLRLGDVNGLTNTRIGDLHIVRVVRRQCSCTGRCI